LADKLERVEVNEEEIATYLPGVIKKLSWLSTEDLLKRVLSLEFNRLLDYYKDAPAIDFIDEKPAKKERPEKGAKPRTDKEKDRRTADRGMARIYVNAGKSDGFYAGNLIEILNKNIHGQRVDVGRIDLLPGYSLFDVRKADAHRVVSALKGLDFFGKRLFSEIADPERDYAAASGRKTKKTKDKAKGKGNR
ncbi:MAG: DbpA RNA binding domain-containing protein, partial [Muribaculaceae bacterium]|nr:DbpA RNA binding domain-containing protein [Muribaculaceae bacterium]